MKALILTCISVLFFSYSFGQQKKSQGVAKNKALNPALTQIPLNLNLIVRGGKLYDSITNKQYFKELVLEDGLFLNNKAIKIRAKNNPGNNLGLLSKKGQFILQPLYSEIYNIKTWKVKKSYDYSHEIVLTNPVFENLYGAVSYRNKELWSLVNIETGKFLVKDEPYALFKVLNNSTITIQKKKLNEDVSALLSTSGDFLTDYVSAYFYPLNEKNVTKLTINPPSEREILRTSGLPSGYFRPVINVERIDDFKAKIFYDKWYKHWDIIDENGKIIQSYRDPADKGM